MLIAKAKGMSSTDALFVSSKYKYALSECKNDKWFIFSLSEMVPFSVTLHPQILIDAIATSNYERFSSSVKDFLVYGSAVYPTISWSFIGYFRAEDTSELQVFNVSTTLWVKWDRRRVLRGRYVRVEWLSWYRNEAICTMSQFRVYGNNMMNTVLNVGVAMCVKGRTTS